MTLSSDIKSKIIKKGSATILYDPRLVNDPCLSLFDPGWLARESRLVGDAVGRGTAWFFQDQGLDLVLRHFRRGGWVGRLVDDLYLGVSAENSRMFREWRLLAELTSRGLPVPQPVAAAFFPRGCCYRGDLVTMRIPESLTLSDRLQQDSLDRAGWQQIGATLKSFHVHGVYHADMNARNILIDKKGVVFLIDFDRGALRRPGAWQEATLQRLLRSLRKFSKNVSGFSFDSDDWNALLVGYAGENG